MIKKITVLFIPIFFLTSFMFPIELNAITAEDRLIEVERQLQAIAEQISKYEGDRTDLEKAIIANDKDLAQVNSELAEVQSRLAVVERELEKALENYVNSKKYNLAFRLYPTNISQVLSFAEKKKYMPQKSTWFHPKPLDGLISSRIIS